MKSANVWTKKDNEFLATKTLSDSTSIDTQRASGTFSSPVPRLLKHYRRERLRFKLAPIAFLAPVLIMFSVFVIWPIVYSMYLSFFEWGGFGPKTFVGLKNYVRLFTDFRFLTSLKNNLYWLIFSLLAPVGGLLLAILLNQRIRGIRLAKSLFFFPFVINLVVVGLVFSWFYNPEFGLLSLFMEKLGLSTFLDRIDRWPFNILSDEQLATFGIILASLWPQIAYCMILYITGLTSLDTQIIEAGNIDGAKGFQLFWHVIIPQLRPVTFIAGVVTIIGALRSFDLIAIMTAGGPYGRSYVLAYQMYQESLFNFNFGYGATLATFLFLIMDLYIVYFLYRIAKSER